MEQFKIVFFGAVMLLYLWVPFSMITNQENIIEQGDVYRFQLAPVDPYDAFRGNYVQLSFGQLFFDQTTDDQDRYKSAQKIYLAVAKDSLGYAYFSGISKELPTSGAYVASKVTYATEREVYVNLPENLQRFYMNEELAPLAEELYRSQGRRRGNNSEHTTPIYAEVSILAGQVQIKDLYFGEEAIGTYLRQTLQAN